jgi:ADP-ribose pyrophosphatase
MTDEAIRVYLAQDLRPCARDVQEHEEVDLTAAWVPVADALRAALSGELENAMAVVGVLAAAHVAETGTDRLRPADAPWRSRPAAAPGS